MNICAEGKVLAAVFLAVVLCSCGGPGGSGGKYFDRDGPPSGMQDAGNIPDAVPRVEPIHQASTRPYVVLGHRYTPMADDAEFSQQGTASWYGKQFHGNKTSCGERYNMYAMTAAHPTMPLPSYAVVTNLGNSRRVIVRVNDRGPFLHSRVMDLSYAAACKLGYARKGTARISIRRIPMHAIRDGSWKQVYGTGNVATAAAARPAVPDEDMEPTGIPQPVPVRTEEPDPAESRQPAEMAEAFHGWTAQIGSFSSRDNALAQASHAEAVLSDQSSGMKVRIVRKASMWAVVVGSAKTRDAARTMATSVSEKLGRPAFAARF